jgi:hypothetical protein
MNAIVPAYKLSFVTELLFMPSPSDAVRSCQI